MEQGKGFNWFQFGDNDLASAKFLLGMHPQPLEQICFLCHQSAEKYLKAFLIFNGMDDFPKTHDLVMLYKLCMAYDERFKKIKIECVALTEYGVAARYPDEIYVDEGLMKKALVYAGHIKECEPLMETRQELEQSLEEEDEPEIGD